MPTTVALPQPDGTALGNPDAPVKVEVFSDFLCSHCNDYVEGVPANYIGESQFIQQYVTTGQVYYVFHPFRVIAPESDNGAEASLCAADQGKFWEYHDVIFANVGTTPSPMSKQALTEFAKAINLDVTQFQDCLSNNKYAQKIQEEQAYGVQKGISGTPSFLINGTEIVGRDQLQSAVESALAGTPVPTSTPIQ